MTSITRTICSKCNNENIYVNTPTFACNSCGSMSVSLLEKYEIIDCSYPDMKGYSIQYGIGNHTKNSIMR